jgi:hypothetical protein
MRIIFLALFSIGLVACSDDSDTTTGDTPCGYGDLTQILAGTEADRVVPDTKTGTLEEVLIGNWQHTWSYDPGLPGDAWTAISDADTDIRFTIPSTTEFIYCQKAGSDGSNKSAMTIEGEKLNITGAGYTATAWTQNIMVWRNDYFADREALYVLERLN